MPIPRAVSTAPFVRCWRSRYGPLLVGVVGVGFVAYGVFCLFRARFARLDPE